MKHATHVNNQDLYTEEAKLMQMAERELSDPDSNQDPIHKLRLLCFKRGTKGLLDISRACRRLFPDNNAAMNVDGFRRALEAAGFSELTEPQIRSTFDAFDKDQDGALKLEEFMNDLRPPMPANRSTILKQAFEKIAGGGEVMTFGEFKKAYSCKLHPKFASGDKTSNELVNDIWRNFEEEKGEGQPSDDSKKATKEDFVNYYSTISATIDSDAYFDLMMRRDYKL